MAPPRELDNSSPPRSAFTTEAQAASRRSARRRYLGAVVVALTALVLLVLLGPDEQEVKERFEYYGAPGELQIMPEVSIEEGDQSLHQLPRSLQVAVACGDWR